MQFKDYLERDVDAVPELAAPAANLPQKINLLREQLCGPLRIDVRSGLRGRTSP